jgi:patatin-like phospholipase/acyl hydrolase
MNKPFRILSIDGGGIRGLFPLRILADIEADLQLRGSKRLLMHEHFDLICGTSTGGIIAIGLALGIPAQVVLDLYYKNAKTIFGKKRGFLKKILLSAHNRKPLENLVRSAYRQGGSEDPRLADCKTSVCVPIYDLLQGKPSVLKTKHHEAYVRDFHIPAYQAALATAAAPTFFDPYSTDYKDLADETQHFSNKVDGGVVMNNPALVAMIEAKKAFGVPLEDLRILSIGTGVKSFCEASTRTRWGLFYWMLKNNRRRLIELFLQGQSQQVENLISLLQRGIAKSENENFIYNRLDTVLDETCNIELDDFAKDKLDKLLERGHSEFQNNASLLRARFFDMVD